MTTAKEWIDTYRESYTISRTSEGLRKAGQYLNRLSRLLTKPLEETTELDLRRIVKARSMEIQAATANVELCAWRKCLLEAARHGFITRKAVRRGLHRLEVQSEPTRKSLTPPELRMLLSKLRPGRMEWYAAHLCMYAGLRRTEALALPLAHIDQERGRILIGPVPAIGYFPKGRRCRVIEWHPDLAPVMEECIAKYGPREFLIKPPSADRYDFLTPCNALDDAMQRAMRQAGVSGRWHRLRHTFADRFMASGGDITSLQHLLGHRNLATTQIYLTQMPDQRASVELRSMVMHPQFSVVPVPRSQPEAPAAALSGSGKPCPAPPDSTYSSRTERRALPSAQLPLF